MMKVNRIGDSNGFAAASVHRPEKKQAPPWAQPLQAPALEKGDATGSAAAGSGPDHGLGMLPRRTGTTGSVAARSCLVREACRRACGSRDPFGGTVRHTQSHSWPLTAQRLSWLLLRFVVTGR